MELNRKQQPGIQVLNELQPHEPEVAQLSNGIPVYQFNSSDQDIVKIELLFEAGKWYEKQPLIANFTNKMLREGTRKHTSQELAAHIDYHGAHIETSSDRDMAYVALYSLNKHLNKTLPVLSEMVMEPVFPVEELERLKQNRKQKFIVNNEKVRYVAKKRFNALLFGQDHPYGRIVEKDDFDRITRDALADFHQQRYKANNCKIIVSGNIQNGILADLNQVFSGFNGSAGMENQIPPSDSEISGEKKNKISKEKSVQSAIRIGRILFNKKHSDYARMKVLNTVLGGYFGSRLMTNIREDKGYTYGIGSAVVSLQKSGYFFIASEVGSNVTSDALREVYSEIEKLQNELIPEDELMLVKNYMLGNFLRSLDGAFSVAENYKSLLEYGLNYEYYHRFVQEIREITPLKIRDTAQKYLDVSNLTELTVGS
jgi:predicted Zn-dependent peptidase